MSESESIPSTSLSRGRVESSRRFESFENFESDNHLRICSLHHFSRAPWAVLQHGAERIPCASFEVGLGNCMFWAIGALASSGYLPCQVHSVFNVNSRNQTTLFADVVASHAFRQTRAEQPDLVGLALCVRHPMPFEDLELLRGSPGQCTAR